MLTITSLHSSNIFTHLEQRNRLDVVSNKSRRPLRSTALPLISQHNQRMRGQMGRNARRLALGSEAKVQLHTSSAEVASNMCSIRHQGLERPATALEKTLRNRKTVLARASTRCLGLQRQGKRFKKLLLHLKRLGFGG